MQGRVEWTGGTTLNGINAAGQSISMDWETGPSPMQLTLQMVGACSLVDVVIGLKERPFSDAWVELDSTRAETAPRRFTSITMVYLSCLSSSPTNLSFKNEPPLPCACKDAWSGPAGPA